MPLFFVTAMILGLTGLLGSELHNIEKKPPTQRFCSCCLDVPILEYENSGLKVTSQFVADDSSFV
jgi:hypothetical protein